MAKLLFRAGVFLLVTFVVMSCGNDEARLLEEYGMPKEDSQAVSQAEDAGFLSAYVWIDKPRMRKTADTDSKPVALLVQGEEVFLTGEETAFVSKLTLRCVEFEKPWVEIMRKDGTRGWVFGGVLADRYQPLPDKLRAVIAVFPETEPDEDELSRVENVFSVCEEKNIYIAMAGKEHLDCVPIGDSLYPITTVSPSRWISDEYKRANGFLFVESGKQPFFISYAEAGTVLRQAEGYFGITLVDVE
jgi:hypothetical protein